MEVESSEKVYLNMLLFCNRLPVFRTNSDFPIKVKSYRLMISIHPEAGQVVANFTSRKCKLTMSHIFLMVQRVSIGRRDLEWQTGKQRNSSSTLHQIIPKWNTLHSIDSNPISWQNSTPFALPILLVNALTRFFLSSLQYSNNI